MGLRLPSLGSLRSLAVLLMLAFVFSGASRWWAHRQNDTLGTELATLVRAGDIRMLSSDTCSICASARAWFSAHRIAFSECSIERDAACRQDFAATLSPGTPVLLVRGKPQVGFNRERLRAAFSGVGG